MSALFTDLYHLAAAFGGLAALTTAVAIVIFAVKWRGKKLAGDEWKSVAEARGEAIAELERKVSDLDKRVANLEKSLADAREENDSLRQLNLSLQLRRA